MRLFPRTRARIAALEQRLDAWAEPYRPHLRALNTAFGFAALAGGVALQLHVCGFASVAAAQCGAACALLPAPEHLAAALCGAAVIPLTQLYAALAATAQRMLIDRWKSGVSDAAPEEPPNWMLYLFGAIGIVLFFTLSHLGHGHATGNVTIGFESGRFHSSIEGYGLVGLLIGWGGGGHAVLSYFWTRARRNEGARSDPAAARGEREAQVCAKGIIHE